MIDMKKLLLISGPSVLTCFRDLPTVVDNEITISHGSITHNCTLLSDGNFLIPWNGVIKIHGNADFIYNYTRDGIQLAKRGHSVAVMNDYGYSMVFPDAMDEGDLTGTLITTMNVYGLYLVGAIVTNQDLVPVYYCTDDAFKPSISNHTFIAIKTLFSEPIKWRKVERKRSYYGYQINTFGAEDN